MKRIIVYPFALNQDTDILNPQRNTMVALGFLMQAAFGTSTLADGLACAQTTVPSMSIDVGPGSMMTNLTVDSTTFGSLPADTIDALVKMGINLGTTIIGPFTAPATSGQSQNFLIQAQVSETDGTPIVMPYFNSILPSSPYSGPGGDNDEQNTIRDQTVLLQVKAGAPATTGSQTTPTPDSGFVGLWVVTIANGATSIVNSNITEYPGAPFISFKVPSIGQVAANGQCKLVYTNSTAITLIPSGGNHLRINGQTQSVPSGGVALANTGLTANTLYYIYASMSAAGAMVLQASTTGHTTSSSDGTEVKSTDATQALVGMVYTGSGSPGVFSDTAAFRGVASWFNRKRRPIAQAAAFASQGTASGTPVEITAAVRATFVTWADETVDVQTTAVIGVSGTGNTASNQVAFDGTVSGTAGQMYSYTTGEGASATGTASALLTEGEHYATAFGATSSGATGTWLSGGLTGAVMI